MDSFEYSVYSTQNWNFPGGPMVKTLPFSAEGVVSTPGREARIFHASWPTPHPPKTCGPPPHIIPPTCFPTLPPSPALGTRLLAGKAAVLPGGSRARQPDGCGWSLTAFLLEKYGVKNCVGLIRQPAGLASCRLPERPSEVAGWPAPSSLWRAVCLSGLSARLSPHP